MQESDDGTLAFYDAEASSYADAYAYDADSKYLKRFMAEIPEGGTVCDLGSGSGWAAAAMRDAGFDVLPIDGSAGLAAEAKRRYDLDVKVMKFDAFSFLDAFDGVWAGWSLHHAPRNAFPGLLKKVGASLKTDGLLFLAMKGGSGEKRDNLDRLYSYHGMDELRLLLHTQVGGDILVADSFDGPGFDGSTTPLHVLILRKSSPRE